MATNIWFWVGFIAFVLAMLALDLGVFHRKAHEVRPTEAGVWVAVWVALALLFAAGLWYFESSHVALTFLTGYVIEESLSVDNLFVMVVIFNYFAVPANCQHRVLFYGILGALIMRGLFIGLGTVLLARFEWILYVFGAMLLVTGGRMMFKHDEEFEGDQNRVVRLVRRFVPLTPEYHGKKFFVAVNGRRLATPLLLVLILVEFTDHIFAVLGLRSMYFLLAAVIERFYLLKYGLAVILSFIGVKMLGEPWFHIDITASLAVVLGTLSLAVVASLVWPEQALGPEVTRVEGRTGSIFGALRSRRRR